jgi:hypothetical protein
MEHNVFLVVWSQDQLTLEPVSAMNRTERAEQFQTGFGLDGVAGESNFSTAAM